MLMTAQTLTGFTLDCTDGDLGKVKDFYFDDQHWAIRYLIADTGHWLLGRQVLISPHALKTVDAATKHISVNLTRRQMEDSPSLSEHEPVSKQFEDSYHTYYGMPAYWGGPYLWGAYSYPYMLGMNAYVEPDREETKESLRRIEAWDPHLRSTRDVDGHHIQAIDGVIGHVEDFVIDDETWAIRYLVIATHNWWPGKKVLLAPRWIERVSWAESKVFVNLTRDVIRQSPDYTPEILLTQDYEIALHRHYGQPGYWIDEPAAHARTH